MRIIIKILLKIESVIGYHSSKSFIFITSKMVLILKANKIYNECNACKSYDIRKKKFHIFRIRNSTSKKKNYTKNV